jgi:NAD(P)-dependent dehydrogenase (short-subunit alcohol dehydrogenase family)
MSEFAGKTVVITGAGRGVGRDIAMDLGSGGANVVVNYATSEEAATRVAEDIRAKGGKAHLCRADVSRSAEVERLFAETLEVFGGVDILVNNAGINIDRPLLELSEDEWDSVIDVNLKGVFLCTQAAGRIMTAARSGHIVNISAVTAFYARKNAVNYSASKAGVNMVTKCAALELAPHVRVNGLALGFFRSEAVERYFTEAQVAEVVDATPLQRMGEFNEITAAVKFLVSGDSAFITGQTIIIDGGRIMR